MQRACLLLEIVAIWAARIEIASGERQGDTSFP